MGHHRLSGILFNKCLADTLHACSAGFHACTAPHPHVLSSWSQQQACAVFAATFQQSTIPIYCPGRPQHCTAPQRQGYMGQQHCHRRSRRHIPARAQAIWRAGGRAAGQRRVVLELRHCRPGQGALHPGGPEQPWSGAVRCSRPTALVYQHRNPRSPALLQKVRPSSWLGGSCVCPGRSACCFARALLHAPFKACSCMPRCCPEAGAQGPLSCGCSPGLPAIRPSIPRPPPCRSWSAIASSADSKVLSAVVRGGAWWRSGDAGRTWMSDGSTRDWVAVAVSGE